jgi:hypothetical protein
MAGRPKPRHIPNTMERTYSPDLECSSRAFVEPWEVRFGSRSEEPSRDSHCPVVFNVLWRKSVES